MSEAEVTVANQVSLPETPFHTLPPAVARAVLAGALLSLLSLLPTALSYRDPPPAHAGDGDLALYGRIVDALHAGASYYPAAHAELIAGHYGTLSVPGWRTPLYLTLVSLFPSLAVAQMTLVALTVIAAGAAAALLWRTAGRATAIAMIPVLFVAVAGCLAPRTVLFSEYACGALILLSACCFAMGFRRTGFAAAVLALFFRELALPYVLVCLVLTWREGRRREMFAWLVSLAAYAGYYAWHWHMVMTQLGPADTGAAEGWLKFGGATFVLSTAAFDGLLVLAPMWIAAAVLVLAVLGLLAWPGAAERRIPLTVFVYLLAFAFVGKPLDRYWGEVYTPLLTLGLAWALPALADLARAARASRTARAAPAAR